MLTRKQYELLRFISERLKESGVPPSFDEMKDALDLRSKSGIHRLITALEERGFIRRLPNRARAIEVIKLPELSAGGSGNSRRGFTPSVIEGTLGRVRGGAEDDNSRPVSVPVMGRIAAGTPRRCRRAVTPSAFRQTCSALENTTRSRCAAIPWWMPGFSTATWR